MSSETKYYSNEDSELVFSKPATTIRQYSVCIPRPNTDLKSFALNHKNCKVHHGNRWRCTYNNVNFTLNIYKWSKFIMFTNVLDQKSIEEEIFKLFHQKPKSVILRNWSIKIKFHKNINLDTLNSDLQGTNLNEIFNIIYKEKILKQKNVEYPKETIQLDKQKFPALILRPFRGYSKITYEIFASGAIGIAGLKTKEDLKIVIDYLETVLKDKLKKSSIDCDYMEDDDEELDLFSF